MTGSRCTSIGASGGVLKINIAPPPGVDASESPIALVATTLAMISEPPVNKKGA